MQRNRWLLTLALAATLAGCPAGTARAGLRFDGSNDPQAPGHIVVETGLSLRLKERPGPEVSPWMFSAQLGYLGPCDGRDTWGGTVKVAADDDGFRIGPTARYRRWLGDTWAVDAGAGVYVVGADPLQPTPTFDLVLTCDDWVGVHAGLDLIRQSGQATRGQPFVGARFGKWLAPGSVAGLLLVALFMGME